MPSVTIVTAIYKVSRDMLKRHIESGALLDKDPHELISVDDFAAVEKLMGRRIGIRAPYGSNTMIDAVLVDGLLYEEFTIIADAYLETLPQCEAVNPDFTTRQCSRKLGHSTKHEERSSWQKWDNIKPPMAEDAFGLREHPNDKVFRRADGLIHVHRASPKPGQATVEYYNAKGQRVSIAIGV